VAPAQEAQIAFASAGIVETVSAATGDRVEAGQVLVRLVGSEKLAAAVEAANLELFSAQQEYDYLFSNLEADRNQALQALNDARQAVRDADKQVNILGGVADSADIDIALSQLVFAEHDLRDAKEKYEKFNSRPQDNLARARFRVVLAEAQKAYDQALRKYNALTGTMNDFDRKQAATKLEIAQKQLELAQKEYDKLQQGPDPERVKAAEARVKNAQAQVKASQSALADLELKAPFGGVVGKISVHSGEWVTPGAPVLLLADLDPLRVKTTDLSERDLPKVALGQPVTVFVKALGLEVPGRVSEISPLAETLGGDVVYQTTIDLEEIPAGLRAGMSVDVQYGDD
jgi:HlyD family secretion protein